MFEYYFLTAEPQFHSFKWLKVPVLVHLTKKKVQPEVDMPNCCLSLSSLTCTPYLLHPFYFFCPPAVLFSQMSVMWPAPIRVKQCLLRIDGNTLGVGATASLQGVLPKEHFYSQKTGNVSAFLSLSLMRCSRNWVFCIIKWGKKIFQEFM